MRFAVAAAKVPASAPLNEAFCAGRNLRPGSFHGVPAISVPLIVLVAEFLAVLRFAASLNAAFRSHVPSLVERIRWMGPFNRKGSELSLIFCHGGGAGGGGPDRPDGG